MDRGQVSTSVTDPHDSHTTPPCSELYDAAETCLLASPDKAPLLGDWLREQASKAPSEGLLLFHSTRPTEPSGPLSSTRAPKAQVSNVSHQFIHVHALSKLVISPGECSPPSISVTLHT